MIGDGILLPGIVIHTAVEFPINRRHQSLATRGRKGAHDHSQSSKVSNQYASTKIGDERGRITVTIMQVD